MTSHEMNDRHFSTNSIWLLHYRKPDSIPASRRFFSMLGVSQNLTETPLRHPFAQWVRMSPIPDYDRFGSPEEGLPSFADMALLVPE